MTTGLLLIAAILVLGGVIATVGDRLGTRVGKARLSLFNLRPRQTATLVAILTGSIISATTLGVLFAVSDQLRTGVFELGRIQRNLREARRGLEETQTEKTEIEQQLREARRQRTTARRRLSEINQLLKEAVDRQIRTAEQLSSTQERLQQIQTRFQQAQTLIQTATAQAETLRSEIDQLQAGRQDLIRQRDQVREQIVQRDADIADRDRAIADREAQIQAREQQLEALESQYNFLAREVDTLYQEFQGLRQGNVALLRNQVLATGVVRVVNPSAAPQAIDQILNEANRVALQRLRPGTPETDTRQVIQISTAQVEQLTSQIQDGKDYSVRVQAAGNYVVGEPCVLAGEACIDVVATALPNQLLFRQGEAVATTTVDPASMPSAALAERVLLLISAAQFRARQAGVLAETITIADNRTEPIINFFEQVRQYNQPIEIQAIAAADIYTAGPAPLRLVGVANNQILFGTE